MLKSIANIMFAVLVAVVAILALAQINQEAQAKPEFCWNKCYDSPCAGEPYCPANDFPCRDDQGHDISCCVWCAG